MNTILNFMEQGFKKCAGNNCNRKGIFLLRVIYLNKLGWFCEFCRNDLMSEGLIIKEGSGNVCKPLQSQNLVSFEETKPEANQTNDSNN